MKMRTWALVLAAVAGLGGEARAQGALPIAVEVRIDGGIPVGETADFFDTGVGFGVDGIVQVTPAFGLYGGYSLFEFEVAEGSGDTKVEGAQLGGRVTLGTGGGVWTPFAQFGALFVDGDTGFEAGLGGFYPVGQKLSVTPMARYRNVDDVEFVTLGVGLNLRF